MKNLVSLMWHHFSIKPCWSQQKQNAPLDLENQSLSLGFNYEFESKVCLRGVLDPNPNVKPPLAINLRESNSKIAQSLLNSTMPSTQALAPHKLAYTWHPHKYSLVPQATANVAFATSRPSCPSKILPARGCPDKTTRCPLIPHRNFP